MDSQRERAGEDRGSRALPAGRPRRADRRRDPALPGPGVTPRRNAPEQTNAEVARLPWRGREEDRPRLPVPPAPMPLLNGRRLRKRWWWVGAFADNLMVFAAAAQIGPASVTFWGVWDRERRRLWERTRRGLPGRRREVEFEGRFVRLRAGSIE